MAEYDVLVINQNRVGRTAQRGHVVMIRLKGFQWKAKELQDPFSIVSYDGTDEEVSELVSGKYRYNFSNQKFIDEDGDEFDSDFVVTENNVERTQEIDDKTLSDTLDPNWKESEGHSDTCEYLRPKFIEKANAETGEEPYLPIRRYFFKKFKKLPKSNFRRKILSTIMLGQYSDFAQLIKNLPTNAKKTIKNKWTFS